MWEGVLVSGGVPRAIYLLGRDQTAEYQEILSLHGLYEMHVSCDLQLVIGSPQSFKRFKQLSNSHIHYMIHFSERDALLLVQII